MKKLIFIFLEEHRDTLIPAAVGGGSFTILLTDINLVLEILIAGATLIYFGIKIYKEVKK